MPERKPKPLPASERAYTYFVRMETKHRHFRMRDVARATGWKIGTVESYRSKKWSWFLVPADRPGYYFSRGLLSHSKEAFIDLHRQKRTPVVPMPQSVIEKRVVVPILIYVNTPARIDSSAWIVVVVVLLMRVRVGRIFIF
jgi:hypothetical protein